MDLLSEVLSLLRLRTYAASGFECGGEWSFRFARHDGIKCQAVVSGGCWLVVEDVEEAIRVETGDCFLLPRGLPFRLSSNLHLRPTDAEELVRLPLRGGIRTWNGGGDFFGVGGHFAFAGAHAEALLQELPPIVHIRGESDRAELRWALERMRQELREERPGGSLVAQQLATTMLVQALRLHLADGPGARPGWLAALVDPQMKAAMTAMHEAPGHAWTLGELATRSGMSRSIFALRFKSKVGTSPMEYLTRWRMLLAGRRLSTSEETVSAIAGSLGYASEGAFSKAFRRVMRCSPRQYRRGGDPDAGGAGERAAGSPEPVPAAV